MIKAACHWFIAISRSASALVIKSIVLACQSMIYPWDWDLRCAAVSNAFLINARRSCFVVIRRLQGKTWHEADFDHKNALK